MAYKYQSKLETDLISLLNEKFMIKFPITKSTKIDDLELDSLDDIELLMEMEKMFNISIDDETWFKFSSKIKTVGDFIDKFYDEIVAKSKPLEKNISVNIF